MSVLFTLEKGAPLTFCAFELSAVFIFLGCVPAQPHRQA